MKIEATFRQRPVSGQGLSQVYMTMKMYNLKPVQTDIIHIDTYSKMRCNTHKYSTERNYNEKKYTPQHTHTHTHKHSYDLTISGLSMQALYIHTYRRILCCIVQFLDGFTT